MRKEKKAKRPVKSSLPLPLRQFLSYLFTGGSATIIDIGVFSLLISFDLWYVAALGISFVFGVSTNFFLSRGFVFKVYWDNWLTQYTVFTIVSLNTLLANLGLLKVLVEDFGWEKIPSRIVSAGFIAVLSFTTHKLYSFSGTASERG